MVVNYKGASYHGTVEILEQLCLEVNATYKCLGGGWRGLDR